MAKFRKAKEAVESRSDKIKKALTGFLMEDCDIDGDVMTNPCGEVVVRTDDYISPTDLQNMQEKAKELNCFLAIRPSVDEDYDSVGKVDFIFDPQY